MAGFHQNTQTENVFVSKYPVRKLNYHRQEILEELVAIRKKLAPDLVLMPSPKDIHQDHSTVTIEGLRAFKNTCMLGYELIWNNFSFDNTAFVAIEEKHVKTKVKALMEYKSQGFRNYVSEDFIGSLAKVRGTQVGVPYAECFEVIRWIIK